MSKIIPFLFRDHGENHEVRAVIIGDEEHFVGKDICDALGYTNSSKAIGDHCKGVTIRYPIVDGLGRSQEMRVLTEADVLRLIVSSKLPAAEAFERWVFEEVLPTIRRTGAFSMPHQRDDSKLTGALAIAECFTRLLKPSPSSQVAMLAHIAKDYGISASFLPAYVIDAAPDAGDSSMPTKPLTALLAEHGIKIGVRAYNQLLADAGLLLERTRKTTSSRSSDGVKHFWSVTEAGLRYGKNITNPNSPRETQPHWYVDRFAELHAEISARLEGVMA